MERVKLDAEEREVQRLQSHCHELKSQLDNCPESMREQLQDHLKREVETLESEAKLFEDLEFQQLEKESRLEEERETVSQQLQQDKAEYQRSTMRRKVQAPLSCPRVPHIVLGYPRVPHIVLGYPRVPHIVLGYPRVPHIVLGYLKVPHIVLGYPRVPHIVLGYPRVPHIVLGYPRDKVSALENQANQIRYQALQECERLTREKNAMMQLLQK
eukprot:g37591.t1